MKLAWYNWLGIVIALAGAGIGIYAAINPMAVGSAVMSVGVDNLANWMPVGMIVLFVVIFGAAFAPFIASARRNSQKKKRLAQVGVKTTAKILSVQDTGLTVNNNPYVKVIVEYKGTQAMFQMLVSRVQIPQPGSMIEIIYDPSDPSCVMPA